MLDGVFEDEHGTYPKGSWLRSPHLSEHNPFTGPDGALIYVKTRPPRRRVTPPRRLRVPGARGTSPSTWRTPCAYHCGMFQGPGHEGGGGGET